MKALSIRQPWAWAILHGGKDIENRNWPTDHRGPLLIHAGKRVDGPGWNWLLKNKDKFGIRMPVDRELLFGGIVGIVEIFDCVTTHDSPWFTGPYGFVLRNARPLAFQEYAGKLRIFEISDYTPCSIPPAEIKKDR